MRAGNQPDNNTIDSSFIARNGAENLFRIEKYRASAPLSGRAERVLRKIIHAFDAIKIIILGPEFGLV